MLAESQKEVDDACAEYVKELMAADYPFEVMFKFNNKEVLDVFVGSISDNLNVGTDWYCSGGESHDSSATVRVYLDPKKEIKRRVFTNE